METVKERLPPEARGPRRASAVFPSGMSPLDPRFSRVEAQAQTAAAKYEVTVPKAWGKFIAFSNSNLLLEAPDQTWRIVDVEGKPPESPKVTVQIRWQ